MILFIIHSLIIFFVHIMAETAENIGYSCNLLREEMNEVFIISGNSSEEVRQELRLVFKKSVSPLAEHIQIQICNIKYWCFLSSRNAKLSMKPDAAEDSEFPPERSHGKGVKVMTDEVVNGEYGLVINGHSLVQHPLKWTIMPCYRYVMVSVCLENPSFFCFVLFFVRPMLWSVAWS